MAEIFGMDLGFDLPSVTGSSWGSGITWIIILFLIFVSIAIGIWIFLQWRVYNKKIMLFENLSGQGYQLTFKDHARTVKIGDGGEELLYLRKKKVYRTAYGRKMGKNTYWFAVGQDGYWYNFLLGDLDAKMNMLDIEPVDRDMRYMHVAIRKNITESYKKINWMERYGTIMFSGIFLIIMIIGLWLLIDQIGELINQATTTVQVTNQLIEPISNIVSKLDSICSGGSGISPV